MGKSSRKKKIQSQDFQKVKLKLGKRKAPAANHTDTSFKSKAIVVTEQNLRTNRGDELTNARNLTLQDLIFQLKHYNPSVRRDAVYGLTELVTSHPTVLPNNLSTAINAVVRLFLDEEPVIRKHVREFCRAHLGALPVASLAPFYPVILAYTCSAMTHIEEDIRVDGLRILNVWTESNPGFMPQYKQRILPIYMDLLRTDTQAKSAGLGSMPALNHIASLQSQHWSPSVRVEIMASLLLFLQAVTTTAKDATKDTYDPANLEVVFWFLDDAWLRKSVFSPVGQSAATTIDVTAQSVPLGPALVSPSAQSVWLNGQGAPFAYLNLFGESTGTAQPESTATLPIDGVIAASETAPSHHILAQLYPFLLATWFEACPLVFVPGKFKTNSPQLAALHLVIQILRVLWRDTHQDRAQMLRKDGELFQMLRHCMVYFPFGQDVTRTTDPATAAILQDMNAAICELVALFMLSAPESGKVLTLGASQSSDAGPDVSPWVDTILHYILTYLGAPAEISSCQSEQSQRAKKLARLPGDRTLYFDLESFVTVLPAIWGLQCSLPLGQTEALYQALLAYDKASRAQSPNKHVVVEYLARLLEIQMTEQMPVGPALTSGSATLASAELWLLTLPKLLWELKSTNLTLSTTIIRTLTLAVQRLVPRLQPNFIGQLQLLLVPFFRVVVPTKGAMFGPFIHLPSDAQKRLIELLYYCPPLDAKLRDAVAACAQGKRLTLVWPARSQIWCVW
ncbi:rRNA processing protein [Dimargaris verticillata]|uniref:Pre-rRNA-processing protein n=1 Tax=Dimargaris verticillata TaxID=2761393 RepID=A0A9W8B4C2_9FUNG|nr:rRNA processing protein [Dimargaris verticillata]